jgi:hypothetical protein
MFRTAFAVLLYFSVNSAGSADVLLSGAPATEGHTPAATTDILL